ncbi:GNAT family N-acetyltransferase [Sphingobium sp. YR768]|uniref:GNAT family N-acetyltransferase n=1 Tax=Sphingobium sp. YR768 TaxID=1884365 RepID=UPI001C4305F5|nr:GNAT family N-acetyltransferase [Sphingobium sp. YR768]
MPDAIRIEDLTGAALVAALDALADLRIAVFRAFPYLYEGTRAYERDYLTAYADSPGALIVGAFAGDQLVGAATAAPMADHAAEFAAPFEARGIDIGRVYYFGESVLLPEWRGHGVGHAFFDRREAKAREHGFAMASFCAVIRPADHPARPTDYSPLDPFWRKRGFAPVDGLTTRFVWRDVGAAQDSDHDMQFWIKPLALASSLN